MNTDRSTSWPARHTPFSEQGTRQGGRSAHRQPSPLSAAERSELQAHPTLRKAALASAFDRAAKAVREDQFDEAAIHAGYALRLMKEL